MTFVVNGITEFGVFPRDRGENPAIAGAEASIDAGAEAKRKSARNPLDLAKIKALKQHEKHEQGEFRRELGVIVYNFDKKEQVPPPCLDSIASCLISTPAEGAVDVVTVTSPC